MVRVLADRVGVSPGRLVLQGALLVVSAITLYVPLVQLTANAVTLGVPGGAAAGAAVSGRLFVRSRVKTGAATR